MTRQGTLAYYLAAWVIGCFVVAFLAWAGEALAGEIHTASILLTTYFISLVFGAVSILFFAFLLRRLMRSLGTHALWIWFLSGASLAFLLIFALNHARSQLAVLFLSVIPLGEFGAIIFAAVFKFVDFFSGRNLWQGPIDGAITALVLCLVDRAFAGASEAAEVKHSPA
jgi:hypothetical protein